MRHLLHGQEHIIGLRNGNFCFARNFIILFSLFYTSWWCLIICFCNPPFDTLNLSHKLHGNISPILLVETTTRASCFSSECFLYLCFSRPFTEMLVAAHQLQLYRFLVSSSPMFGEEGFKPTISWNSSFTFVCGLFSSSVALWIASTSSGVAHLLVIFKLFFVRLSLLRPFTLRSFANARKVSNWSTRTSTSPW